MTGTRLAAAIALWQQGKARDAWQLCDSILASGAYDFDTLNVAGSIALQAGEAMRAMALLDQAVTMNPTVARTYCTLGMAQHATKQYQDAVASFDRALALKPSLVDAHINRAAALTELKRLDEALASCDMAIAANPNAAEAYVNRGIIFRQLERYDAALADYARAIELQPTNYRLYDGRARALESLKRLEDALAAYDQVIKLKPDLHTAYISRGLVLTALGRFEEALAANEAATALKPRDPTPYANRGEVLRQLNRHEDAVASYDCALAIDPTYRFIPGMRIGMKLQICDWTGLDGDIARLTEQVAHGEEVAAPFAFLAVSNAPQAQLKCAEIWDNAWHKLTRPLPPLNKLSRHDKIRIGYFTGDFYAHAVGFLIAEIFELHDSSRFEITAFCFSPTTGDYMQERLRGSFDHFIEIRDRPDVDVATLAREMEIDIAVDLKGLTNEARGRLFAHRAAPIQVNYLGYPGTMGAAYMDYIIADPVLIPETDRRWYTEKVVTLPDTYQPNDTHRAVAAHTFTRAELGLPEGAFVFVCFNNTYKILPQVFDIWMRVLGQVDDSVLWLLGDNPTMIRNLRREAQARGVDPARLVFADRAPMPLHIARQVHGDLFLDTAPYNAHTTASDALWMGLPVITCPGETFAGRVAASLLNAADLSELVAKTWEDYERLAVSLAHSPEKIAALKDRLRRARTSSRLFDSRRFTRNLEAAYTAMYERLQAGLPPDHIAIG